VSGKSFTAIEIINLGFFVKDPPIIVVQTQGVSPEEAASQGSA
jgi:hypothetical protein